MAKVLSKPKRIAVLADIHSNHIALRACIQAALKKGADTFFFLGDYLGDLAYPQKTLQVLYELQAHYPCCFVRGNKEEYWLSRRGGHSGDAPVWREGSSTTGMLAYNFARLEERDLAFMADMPVMRRVRLDGCPELLLCHGSPFRVDQSMRPDGPHIDELTAKIDAPLVLCGHFHIQTSDERNGVRVINPGAVGVPLHSRGQTQFLLLHGAADAWETEFMTLPYDVQAALAEMEAEELFRRAPYWARVTRHLLLTGEVPHPQALTRVMAICRRQGLPNVWPELPETAWKQAVEELGL